MTHGSDARMFPRTFEASRDARAFVAGALAALGADGIAQDASLLVSELVTNAVLHTNSEVIGVEVSAADSGRFRCAVTDQAPDGEPCVQPVDLTTVGGSGLLIVEQLATRWGWDRDGDTKAVWFEIDRVSPQ